MAFLHMLWVVCLVVFGAFSLSGAHAVVDSRPASIADSTWRQDTLDANTKYKSFEDRCEAELAPTSVSANWMPADVNFDHSRSIQALSRDSKSTPGNVVLGVTQSALASQFSFGMDTLTDPVTGRTCMRPQIAIRVSAGAQKVFVAHEFNPGSCAYQAVLEHELQHARANDEQAMFTARRLEGEISRILGNRVFYGTREELESHLTSAIKEHWMPLARRDLQKVETDHAHIDRKAENVRVLSSCNGDVVRAISSSVI